MGIVITIEDIKAYTEVNYIINHMNEKYINEIPNKLLKFFSDFSDPSYDVKINPHIPLQNQGLQRYTLEIVAVLHLKYWCEDENRKKELYNIMIKNEEKLDDQIKYRDSIENLFGDNNDDIMEEELEEQDFSKPKTIQRYERYTEKNDDIQDYTDYSEEEASNQNLVKTELNSQNMNAIDKIKYFLQKLKEKIQVILKK